MFKEHMIKLILTLVLFATSLSAFELSGNFSSQIYVYERNDSSHIRIYERLKTDFNIWQSQHSKSLDFHLYLRYNTDLKNKLSGDPETYVYDTYFILKNIPPGTDLRIGRQFVYNTIGSGLVDGIRLKGSLSKNSNYDFYGGSLVNHLDPESIQSLANYGSYGSMISYRYKKYRLAINWQLRYFDGGIASHLVGTDISLRQSKYYLLGKFVYNLENKRVGEILSRVSYNLNSYYLSAEFQWREPHVRSNSLFSLIDFRSYKEFRFELHRRLGQRFRIISGLDINLYEGEDALGGKIGLSGNNWSLIWVHRSGLGKNSNGINYFISMNLTRSLKAYHSGNFSRYKVQELQNDLNDSYMSIIGAELRLKKGFSIKSEFQYLRNGITKNDIRFNLNISKSFKSSNRNSGGQ